MDNPGSQVIKNIFHLYEQQLSSILLHLSKHILCFEVSKCRSDFTTDAFSMDCFMLQSIVSIYFRFFAKQTMHYHSSNSKAHEWRHDSDQAQTNKLEWWMILKISLRAKSSVPKTLLKQKLCLHSLYLPQNMLMSTESRWELSDLHSIF